MSTEDREGGEEVGLLTVLTDKKLRFPLVVSLVVMVTQQFSGINNVFNYSTNFLQDNGLSADTVSLIALLMNCGNVLVTVIAVWLMNKSGRKPLLLLSAAGM